MRYFILALLVLAVTVSGCKSSVEQNNEIKQEKQEK